MEHLPLEEDEMKYFLPEKCGRVSDVIGLDRYWMDGIRMDFGWIGSAWLALLDGLDGL
jgi:hypothetical protein